MSVIVILTACAAEVISSGYDIEALASAAFWLTAIVVVVPPEVKVRLAFLADEDVFAATVAVTVEPPVPLVFDSVSQEAFEVRVQPTESASVIVKVRVDPEADTCDTVVGLIEPSAAATPAWVTVRVSVPPE